MRYQGEMNDPGEPIDPESLDRSAVGPVRSRVCIRCGKSVAADRKWLCDHCGEPFEERGDQLEVDVEPKLVELTVTSRRGLVVGVALALAITVSMWVLAFLVQHGLAPYDQLHAALNPLAELSLLELVLGPVGIVVVGWSAGVRSGLAWTALVVLGVPVLTFAWIVSVVTVSGALGEPF